MNIKKTVAFSKNAVNVFFHILTDCNLKCKHCYINKAQHGENRLSLPSIETWLKIFSDKNNVSNVIFLGGEPTMHPDLSRAIKKARELQYNSITVDTNGYLFHDILSRVSPEEVDFFSFSLDGASRKTNDMIRGKGSYDTCIAGIKKARRNGFNTSIIYTVCGLNLNELPEMPELLEDLKPDRFFIQVIGLRGKSAGKGKNILQVSRPDWLNIVPDISRRIARSGITVTYPKVYLNTDEKFECAGLVAKNYFIFPNGRVYRCPLCEDYPLHSMIIRNNFLFDMPGINEKNLFHLNIQEGCVMNKLIQPDNLSYLPDGGPEYKVACCMLKEELRAHSKIT